MINKIIFFICFIVLIIIHTVDLELTTNYIGNNYEQESFVLMAWAIKNFGIYNAVWLSRLIMYPLFFTFLCYQDNKKIQHVVMLLSFLYVTSMWGWLGILFPN